MEGNHTLIKGKNEEKEVDKGRLTSISINISKEALSSRIQVHFPKRRHLKELFKRENLLKRDLFYWEHLLIERDIFKGNPLQRILQRPLFNRSFLKGTQQTPLC